MLWNFLCTVFFFFFWELPQSQQILGVKLLLVLIWIKKVCYTFFFNILILKCLQCLCDPYEATPGQDLVGGVQIVW